jgi:hypothetical protein
MKKLTTLVLVLSGVAVMVAGCESDRERTVKTTTETKEKTDDTKPSEYNSRTVSPAPVVTPIQTNDRK